jgi:6-phosphogluconate dehydrogenase
MKTRKKHDFDRDLKGMSNREKTQCIIESSTLRNIKHDLVFSSTEKKQAALFKQPMFFATTEMRQVSIAKHSRLHWPLGACKRYHNSMLLCCP